MESRSPSKTAWSVSTLNLQALLPNNKFTNAWQVFQPLRMVKDETETGLMRKAGGAGELAMGEVLKKLRVGVSELEISTEIDYQLAGAARFARTSFPRLRCTSSTPARGRDGA